MSGDSPLTWPRRTSLRRRRRRVVDKCGEPSPGQPAFVPEELQSHVQGEKPRGSHLPNRCPVAAPRPLVGQLADAGAYGVEEHIANDFEELSFALDHRAAEAALKEVAGELVAIVEPRRVPAIEPVHAGGEVF